MEEARLDRRVLRRSGAPLIDFEELDRRHLRRIAHVEVPAGDEEDVALDGQPGGGVADANLEEVAGRVPPAAVGVPHQHGGGLVPA